MAGLVCEKRRLFLLELEESDGGRGRIKQSHISIVACLSIAGDVTVVFPSPAWIAEPRGRIIPREANSSPAESTSVQHLSVCRSAPSAPHRPGVTHVP